MFFDCGVMPCWHTTAPCVDSLCRHPTDSRSCIWSAAIAYCFGCVQRWRLVRQLAFFGHHRVLSVCVDAAIIAWTISRKKLENILNSYFFGDMIRPAQRNNAAPVSRKAGREVRTPPEAVHKRGDAPYKTHIASHSQEWQNQSI